MLSGTTFDAYKNTGDDSNEYKYGLLAIRAGIYDRHAATVGQLYNFGARAGTTSKPVALFTQGALLTTPLNGAWEFNGTALYFTINGVRRQVQLASTGTQSFSATSDATSTPSVQNVDPTISMLMEEIAALKERVSQLENKLNEK
ncbi:hypothetical protein QFZ51_002087 [Chitinophaga sp. W3I9]|uniref:hypothetical protein n=1 Tax=Chitinophaga sp. W3I9 TaxID=3373924 RepID=UPI003D252D93